MLGCFMSLFLIWRGSWRGGESLISLHPHLVLRTETIPQRRQIAWEITLIANSAATRFILMHWASKAAVHWQMRNVGHENAESQTKSNCNSYWCRHQGLFFLPSELGRSWLLNFGHCCTFRLRRSPIPRPSGKVIRSATEGSSSGHVQISISLEIRGWSPH